MPRSHEASALSTSTTSPASFNGKNYMVWAVHTVKYARVGRVSEVAVIGASSQKRGIVVSRI